MTHKSTPIDSKLATVVQYLEHPKVIKEFHGSTLDGMLVVDFDTHKLEDMIKGLSKDEWAELLEKVTVVCAQWSGMRVAPNNDIGTIARYQEARLILEATEVSNEH